MATRLKTWHPDVAFGGAKVGADEVDFYHTYMVMFPSIDGTALATAKGTPAATAKYALAANVTTLDYPRNIVLKLNNTSGSTNGGTVTVNGKNQFGDVISETFTVTGAANGGTTVGTKVFAEFTSGTAQFSGAGNASNGCTANVGFGTAGTTTLFGLPFKVGGTKDLLNLSWASAGANAFIASAALGSYVSTAQHAVLARTDFVGTSGFTAWFKSTKDQSDDVTGVVGR
jgi:hypothetical protein